MQQFLLSSLAQCQISASVKWYLPVGWDVCNVIDNQRIYNVSQTVSAPWHVAINTIEFTLCVHAAIAIYVTPLIHRFQNGTNSVSYMDAK